MALSLGKTVAVIGEYGARNVFAHLPGVERYATFDDYLNALDDQSTFRVAMVDEK